MVSVRAGVETDRAAVVGVLLRGFAADPWSRWWFPSDEAWSERAPEFFGLGFDARMQGGGEIVVSEPMASVALWTPPGGNRHGEDWVTPRAKSPHIAEGDSSEVQLHLFGDYAPQLDFAGILWSSQDCVPEPLRSQTVTATATLVRAYVLGCTGSVYTPPLTRVVLPDGASLTYSGPIGYDCVDR